MDKAKYGMWVVVLAIVAVIAAPAIAAYLLATWTDVKVESINAIAGPATTAIAVIAGAFFGINVGLQGKAEAEAAKDTAKDDAAKARAEAAATRAVAIAYAGQTKSEDEVRHAIEVALQPSS